MRIVTASDLHFGKPKWDTFGHDVITKVCSLKPDVFLFTGDMAEPGHLQEALETTKQIPADIKLWVAGNNDIELMDSLDYEDQLQETIKPFGFHLLDTGIKIVDKITFVGQCAWYNGELWKGTEEQRIIDEAKAHEYWIKNYANGAYPTAQSFFDRQISRLREMLNCERPGFTVLSTHFAPSDAFPLYGHSERFDYLNYFMGFDITNHALNMEGVDLITCGHTHRRKFTKINGIESINLSGSLQEQGFILSYV